MGTFLGTTSSHSGTWDSESFTQERMESGRTDEIYLETE